MRRLGLAACVAFCGFLLSTSCKRGSPSDSTLATQGSALREPSPGNASSCKDLAATCGPSGKESCCRSLLVTGGSFRRGYDGVDFLDPQFPATVSDFYLDRYEVTVGRVRAFVRAGWGTQTSAPPEGAGAHPKIPGSGWSSTWNAKLAPSGTLLRAALACHEGYQTWTSDPGSNENKPANCVDWYTAFAFCAWDGGRLPTEAEWNYAAAGGSEQRYYPWSSPPNATTIDDTYAVYCGRTCKLFDVGSKSPKGDGKWGQADLGGNVWEWNLDTGAGAYPLPCRDCADVSAGAYRAFRSGSNDDIPATLRGAVRHLYYPNYHGVVGVRCARDLG